MKRPLVTRRALLAAGLAAAGAAISRPLAAKHAEPKPAPSLAELAAKKGLLFGASFAMHELDRRYGPRYSDIYINDASIVTSELEFKMSSLRPVPGKLEFAAADRLADFAAGHNMKLRGHTLIWNDDLPDWITQLTPKDAERLLEDHIVSVVERYRDRVAYWDVVNEPIGPWDKNAGNLRGGPFYAALGPGYIAKAFRTARAVAPSAKLVLNEAQSETADANGQTFRTSLLDLLKRLKDEAVPVDAVGIQNHLKAAGPNDFPAFAAYLAGIASLGYEIHITELDVNDTGIAGSISDRDAAVAGMYEDYLDAVLALPAVKVVELWQLSDRTSWMRDPGLPSRMKMRTSARPLIYDDHFRKKPAWDAVARALQNAPKR